MKLVIATKNEGKFAEIASALADLPIEPVRLDAFSVPSFEETGDNFKVNSLMKASYYYNQLSIPVLADDSGLAVDVLNGEPGVYSRRWPGHPASDEELMQLLLDKLAEVPDEQRTARFICAMSFIYDPQHSYSTEHEALGRILREPVLPVGKGIPWSSLFLADEPGKVYSQLTPEEKNKYSHRGGALRKIKPFIIRHAEGA